MLHAKDLMTGDIILYEYQEKMFPARILEIYHKSLLVEEYSHYFEPIEIDQNKIFPITLTPEILEKNGFSRNGLDIALFDRKGGDDFIGASNLQYVHELQHALRLCGIEKDIITFGMINYSLDKEGRP